MKIVLDDEIFKEIDYIIDNLANKFGNEVPHLESLAFFTQTQKDARDNIKNEYETMT